MSAPARVLLVRTSSLGDVVHSLPVLTALRRAWPEARIAWTVEEAYVPLLEGHPDLDLLVPVALRRWRRRPLSRSTLQELGAVLARLSDFGAEIAVDLMGSHKGAMLSALSYAPRRIGLSRRHRREPGSAIWINEPVECAEPHAVDRQLSLLAALGVAAEPVDFGAEKIFRRHPCDLPPHLAGERFACIHPGAAWGNKRLPWRTWGEVAIGLRQRFGVPVVVGAGPGEEELASAVAVAGRAEVVSAPTLPELAALARAATLFLAGDTGPLHLARAFGTPVVCVMGPTDPARHGPFRAPGSVVVTHLPCSFCHRPLESARACLAGIGAETVLRHAELALSRLGAN